MVARLAAWLILLSCVAGAAPASETARQILDRQKALDDGARRWSDRHEQLRMEVLDPPRAPRVMMLDLFDKKVAPRQQKTMAYFSAPESVKGTAFLALTHPDRPADQWLYLPEGKRARRIGGEARRSGFVGTDFTYHDLDLLAEMPTWTDADATASLRGEAAVDGVPCYVIELTPQRAEIGYQHIVLWLGRDDLVPRQVELFAEAPSAGWFGLGGGTPPQPARRVRQHDLRLVGAIPVPGRAEIETPAAGTRTIVTFLHVAFDQHLPDDLFTQPALGWGRFAPAAAR
ncbi:MAG: outer membrane lipoprotein-sorting protein [Candidatus Binatia bacterium]